MKQTAIELPVDHISVYLGELMADFATVWKKLDTVSISSDIVQQKLSEIDLEIKNNTVTLPGFTRFQEHNLEHSAIQFVRLFAYLKNSIPDNKTRQFLGLDILETKILSVRQQAQDRLSKIQNSQTIFREKNPFREVYLYKFIKRLDDALDGSR
jgi:hypothetical protein